MREDDDESYPGEARKKALIERLLREGDAKNAALGFTEDEYGAALLHSDPTEKRRRRIIEHAMANGIPMHRVDFPRKREELF